MSASSKDYARLFAHLHTNRNAQRWSAETLHRAPHKPFLLLAIMDLIAQGVISDRLIRLDTDLVDAFELYWTKVIGRPSHGKIALPFYHLRGDGFWHLVPVPGMEQALAATGSVDSIVGLRRLVLGATLDEDLFALLADARRRDDLRRILVETYFAPEVRPRVVEASHITAESFEYSRELLQRSRGRFTIREVPEADEQYRTESRSTAFRRVIVEAYSHMCALCGIRLQTPEGHTAVAAAHIVPWSVSHNDDPRNGLALCGLHHWAFDEGLVTVAPDYRVVVSTIVPRDDSAATPLLALASSPLRQPADHTLHPADEACAWHRKKIFRA